MDTWKLIKEYPGYMVSRTGEVYNLRTNKTLMASKHLRGYVTASVKGKNLLIHRLVAMAFIPNEEQLPAINHLNGNKIDNRVENLEWCTNAQNSQHASDNDLFDTTPVIATAGGTTLRFKSQAEAQRQTGTQQANIWKCCNGKRQTAGGYGWEYDGWPVHN